MTPNRFVLSYSPGPAWVEGLPLFEQPLEGHAEYQKELLAQGLLEMSGPFLDRDGGLAVLRTGDESEAQCIARKDPAVRSGVFAVNVDPFFTAFHSDESAV